MARRIRKQCPACQQLFLGRSDAIACSERCRKRLQRARRALANEAKEVEAKIAETAKQIEKTVIPEWVNEGGYIEVAEPPSTIGPSPSPATQPEQVLEEPAQPTPRPVGADVLPNSADIAPAALQSPVTAQTANIPEFENWLDSHSTMLNSEAGQVMEEPSSYGVINIPLTKFMRTAIAAIVAVPILMIGGFGIYSAIKGSPPAANQSASNQQASFSPLTPDNSTLHINYNTVVDNSKKLSLTGPVVIQNDTDSNSVFKIQSASGNNILVADAINGEINIGNKPAGQVALHVNGDITTNGALVSTSKGYSLSNTGLTLGGKLVCTANGCVSSSSPAPTPSSPTIDVANLAYLNVNQTFSGINTFTGSDKFKGNNSFTGRNSFNNTSTTAFQVQNSAGTDKLFVVDTVNNRIGIGTTPQASGATVQIAGDINISSGVYKIGNVNGGSFACAAGEVLQNATITGGIVTAGSCVTIAGGTTPTLQQVYDASGPADIRLSSISGMIQIQDSASPLATDLFEVTNSAGTTKYFAVNSLGISVTGNINTTGQYQINGTQISSSNLSDSANLAKLNGNQTFTGANNFSNASNSFTGSGAGLTSLNATNISSGTLNNARLSAQVTLQGNTFNGANQLVQLTAGGILPVLSGANLTNLNASSVSSGTLSDARLSSNVALLNANQTFTGNDKFTLASAALSVQDASTPLGADLFTVTDNSGATKYFEVSATGVKINGSDVCTSAGNCVGTGGGGAIGGSGTAGKLAKFTGSGFTIGDSLISDNGTSVSVGGNLSLSSGSKYQINGTQIASSDLSDGSNLAKLNGNQTFTGANTFSNASNSFTGSGAGLTSLNASNISSGTLADGRLSSNVALLNANQTFTGNNKFTLNTAGLAVQDAASPLGTNLFEVDNNNGTTKYFTVSATALQFLGQDVCTKSGNCAGAGNGGGITGSGSQNTLTKFDASGNLVNSIISDNGSTATVAGTLSVNTITPTATLTVGTPSQTLTLQGDGSTSLSAKSGSFTNSLVFAAPALSSKTITIPNATGTVAVSASGPLSLDAAGNLTCPNCLTTDGTGGGKGVFSVNSLNGAITLAGTSNQVIITPGGNTLTFSTPQDIGTSSNVDFGSVNVTGQYKVGGSQISSANLSNDANLAKLNANQTFTGNNTFDLNSSAFTIQDAASPLGTDLFEVTDNSGATKYFTVSATALQFLGQDVCTMSGNCTGVSGGGIGGGGTLNTIPLFTPDGFNIGDSDLTQSGTTVTAGHDFNITGVLGVNTITPTATLTVGTPTQTLTLQGDASTKFTAKSGSFTNSLVFAAPAVSNKTITIPNATGTVAVSASGPLSLDAAGNLTCPNCLTTNGSGGGNGVTDVNGITSSVTLAGTPNQVIITPGGNTLTFSTPQDINTTSSPTFANINLGSGGVYKINNVQISSANLSNDSNLAKLNGNQTFTGTDTFSNTITAPGITAGGAALGIGASTDTLNLAGTYSSNWAVTNGTNSTTVGFSGIPTANVNYNFDATASAGTYTICTTANTSTCAASGSVTTSSPGTNGTIAMFTGAQTIANSIITQSGGTVTVGGTLDATTLTQGGTGVLLQSTSFSGDVSGTYNSTSVDKLKGTALSISSLADTNFLIYNSTSGNWENHSISGDLTIDNSGSATIGTGAVTSAKIADGTIAAVDLSAILANSIAYLANTQTFTGGNTFQNTGATAFSVQSASGADTMLNVDTSARGAGGGNLVKIGNSTGTDGNTTILVVDSATAAPTSNLSALNGGIFYNSTDGHVSVIEGGVVKELCNQVDLSCGGNSTTLQQAYDNSSSPASIVTSAAAKNIIIQSGSGSNSSSVFQIQDSSGSSNLFIADTVHNRIAIDQASATYTLDVAGDINTTTGYRVGGTAGTTVTCSSGNVVQNATITGGIITGGTCVGNGAGVAPTLAQVYNNGTNSAASVLALNSTAAGILVRDNASPIGGTLFGVQDSTGTNKYLDVTSSGITVGGNVNSTGQYQVNGTQIASSNLSDGSNLAKLNGNQTFTGNNTFQGTVLVQNTGTTAFQIQNASVADNLFIADTTNHRIAIGQASATYKLDVAGDINTTTGFRVGGTAGSGITCSGGNVIQNQVVTGGIITGGTCVANGAGATTTLQNAYDNSASPATITTSSVAKNIIIKSGNTFNSTGLFQIQDASGNSVLNADSVNRYVGINNAAPNATLDVLASSSSFFDGFETGAFSPFIATGVFAVGTGHSHTGSYSVNASGTNGTTTSTLSLTKTLNSAGTVSYWIDRQETVYCSDFTTFKIDGVTQTSYGCAFPGTYGQNSFAVSSGTHTFTWTYPANQSGFIYIDDVTVTNAGVGTTALFNGGNVGIGTSFPNYTLDVSGTTHIQASSDSSTEFQVQNSNSGQVLTVNSTTNSVVVNQGNLTVSGLSNMSTPTLTSSATGGTLAAGTYYYQVAAVNANGTTPAVASNPASVTTSGSTSQNTLTWPAVTNAASYNVYRSTNGTTWDINNVSSSTTSIADNGSTYTWSTVAAPPATNTTGGNLNVNGGATFTNLSNSTDAFDIQDATSDSIFRVDSTDRFIGINNSTPSAALDVVASAPAPNFFFGFEDGTLGQFTSSSGWAASTTNTHTGSYKAQTTTGNSTMSLTRTISTASTLSFWMDIDNGCFTGGQFKIDSTVMISEPACSSPGYVHYSFAVSSGTHTFTWLAASFCCGHYQRVDDVTITPNSSTNNVALFNGGNVGIGTTSPGAILSVSASSLGDTTSLFQVQNAAGTSMLNADSTNMKITVGQSNLLVTDLSAPSSPAVVAGANTGGTLSGAAGTTYYYKITALNGAGESLASSETSINGQSFTKLSAPAAPTGAATTGSNLGVGNYLYKLTVVTANGETTAGTQSATITTTSGNQSVNLTIPAVPTGATGYKVYRTAVGGASNSETLITAGGCSGTISTTSCTDSATDAQLSGSPPASNTATTNLNNATVSWTTVAGATSYRIYRGTSPGAESAYQTSASSPFTPFTDTGAAGTAGSMPSRSTVSQIGIGTATPAANLDVEGTALFKNIQNNTNAFQLQDAHGNMMVNLNTAANAIKDDLVANAPSGTLLNSAIWSSGQYVTLNSTSSSNGELEYNQSIDTSNFDASFQMLGNGGGGFKADGTWFYIYNTSTPTSVGSATGGYAVDYDEWIPEITLRFNGSTLASASSVPTISDGNWHNAEINMTNTSAGRVFKIYFDGSLVINYTDSSVRTLSGTRLGLGGWSSIWGNTHRVRNFTVLSGASQVSYGSSGDLFSVSAASQFNDKVTIQAPLQVENSGGQKILSVDNTTNATTISQGNVTISGLSIPQTPTLTSSATGGTLAAGTYYYQVAAVNATGTTPAVPSNPTSITTSGTTSQNTLTWTAVTNAVSYNVYRSTNGTTWDVNNVTSSTTSIIDNGSTYAWSTTATIPTTNTTGGNLTVDGAVTVANSTNSTSALQVQDTAGDSVLQVDSTNRFIGINKAAPAAALDVVASQAAPTFYDGFEDGTFGPFVPQSGWTVGTGVAHSGNYSANSSAGNPLTLTNTISSAGTVSFYLEGCANDTFRIDGVNQSLPGNNRSTYTFYSFQVSAGSHTYVWIAAGGLGCGFTNQTYVDDVKVTPNSSTGFAGLFNGGNVGIGTTAPNATLETDGTAIFKAVTNATSTFQIQNSTGDNLLNADSTNQQITIGQFVDSTIGTPASPGVVVGSNQGGNFSGAPGTTYYYKISAMTASGESPLSSEVSVSSSSFTPLTAPTAPTVGTPAAGGSVNLGTHSYKVTFVTANGETTGGTTSSQVNITTGGTQTVPLTSIPTGPTGTTARKIYRTVAGDTGSYLLVTTIANNTSTSFNDTVADASLGAAAPVSNTATTNTNNTTVSWTAVSGAKGYRVYRATASGAETSYQATASSPFTDTGAAGTAISNTTLSVKGVQKIQSSVNSTTAFQVQNASGTVLFNVDTTTSTITLGSASSTPVLLVLGNKNTSGDPACTNGAVYYNSNTKRFRACTNGSWATFGAFAPGYEISYDQITSNVSLTATTEASSTTAITSSSFTYDGNTTAMVDVYVPNLNTSGTIGLGVWLDGTEQFGHTWPTNTGGDSGIIEFKVRITPTSGSHTITVRGWDSAGTGTLDAGTGTGGASTYQPAYIRISVAN